MTVPITTLPSGLIPHFRKCGSMSAMPSCIALAAISTSGINTSLFLNLAPIMSMPAINPLLRISGMLTPASRAAFVSFVTLALSPRISDSLISFSILFFIIHLSEFIDNQPGQLLRIKVCRLSRHALAKFRDTFYLRHLRWIQEKCRFELTAIDALCRLDHGF